MTGKRISVLFVVLALLAVAAAAGWLVGSRIQSPAEAAARTAPPEASPILVPVEKRVLSSNVVTRGTARFGLPQPISIAPSVLKPGPGLFTTLPLRNKQLEEGSVMLTASGRPVFVLQGKIPAYRDLVPGISGDDVRHLEEALKRMGFDPGPVDGTYDQQTCAAVARWYERSGWEPFGPTIEQLAKIRTLERDCAEAAKNQLAAADAAAVAARAVEAARAKAEHADKIAATEVQAKVLARDRLLAGREPLALESARASAEHAKKAAAADIAAKISDRALVVLDPYATRTARSAADAKLEVARAGAFAARLKSELDVDAVAGEVKLAQKQLELARAAAKAARIDGEVTVQTAVNAQKIADLDAQLAKQRADRLAAELDAARRKVGVQAPVDEIVFVPALPVRVEEVTALVGDPAKGPVMSVTDNLVSIDSSLPLDAAPLVKPGMAVTIDERALGIEATGVVKRVASTPGTHGVDCYHFYFEVAVDKTTTRLEGFSLRLTIPIKSTEGAVIAVPISALSLAADGTSRVQVENNGALEYVVVEPGLSADGFVEVQPVDGSLEPGQLVVVGYENNQQPGEQP